MLRNTVCRRIEPLLWNYAADRLSEAERKETESHLETCVSCREALSAYALLADSASVLRNASAPPSQTHWAELRERILQEAPKPPRRAAFLRTPWMCGAFASAACVGALFFQLSKTPLTPSPNSDRTSSVQAAPFAAGNGDMMAKEPSKSTPLEKMQPKSLEVAKGETPNSEIQAESAGYRVEESQKPRLQFASDKPATPVRRASRNSESKVYTQRFAVDGEIPLAPATREFAMRPVANGGGEGARELQPNETPSGTPSHTSGHEEEGDMRAW